MFFELQLGYANKVILKLQKKRYFKVKLLSEL